MNSFFKKNICALLIISIIIPTIFFNTPKKAEAILGFGDTVFDANNYVQSIINMGKAIYTGTQTALTRAYTYIAVRKETVLDPLAYAAARTLIRSLTQSIVDWINNGFEGSPSFIQDPGSFLSDTADRAVGDFILGTDLAFLCDPFGDGQFKLNIQAALNLSFGTYSGTQDKIRCRLSDALKNTEDAYKNFINGDFVNNGGWDSWLNVTTNPQNNQIGAMVIAQVELDSKITSDKAEASMEAGWGTGTLSMKQCTEKVVDKNGNTVRTVKEFKGNSATHDSTALSTADMSAGYSTKVSCSTVTPGSLINQQMEDATGSDLKQLQLADEFNEIVGALANYAIKSVMDNGLLGTNAGTTDEERASATAAWSAGIASEQAVQDAALADVVSNATDDMNTADTTAFEDQNSTSTATTTGAGGAANIIKDQIRIEGVYQRAVSGVLDALYLENAPSAYKSFADIATTTCNPLAEKVLDIITGVIPYNETDPERLAVGQNLNVPALETLVTQSNTNLSKLGALRDSMLSTTTPESLLTIIASNAVNNVAMHKQSDIDAFKPRGVSYNRIVTWLTLMKNTYAATTTRTRGSTCTVDLRDWNIR